MIETVRPNRLKLELSFKDKDSGIDTNKDAEVLYSSDGDVEGTLFSQWLHGAKANKLKADISVKFAKRKLHLVNTRTMFLMTLLVVCVVKNKLYSKDVWMKRAIYALTKH